MGRASFRSLQLTNFQLLIIDALCREDCDPPELQIFHHILILKIELKPTELKPGQHVAFSSHNAARWCYFHVPA